MESGSVMDTKFQIYESHLPFLLQFLVDYNLYGMENINLDFYIERRSMEEVKSKNHSRKTSVCELEVDTWASDIMNRRIVKERPRDALADINENLFKSYRDIALVPSLAAVWKVLLILKQDEQTRREKLGFTQYQKVVPIERMDKKPWLNQEKLKNILDKRIGEFSTTLVQKSIYDQDKFPNISTVFGSICALHPKEDHSIRAKSDYAEQLSWNVCTLESSPVVDLKGVLRASQEMKLKLNQDTHVSSDNISDDLFDDDIDMDDLIAGMEQIEHEIQKDAHSCEKKSESLLFSSQDFIETPKKIEDKEPNSLYHHGDYQNIPSSLPVSICADSNSNSMPCHSVCDFDNIEYIASSGKINEFNDHVCCSKNSRNEKRFSNQEAKIQLPRVSLLNSSDDDEHPHENAALQILDHRINYKDGKLIAEYFVHVEEQRYWIDEFSLYRNNQLINYKKKNPELMKMCDSNTIPQIDGAHDIILSKKRKSENVQPLRAILKKQRKLQLDILFDKSTRTNTSTSSWTDCFLKSINNLWSPDEEDSSLGSATWGFAKSPPRISSPEYRPIKNNPFNLDDSCAKVPNQQADENILEISTENPIRAGSSEYLFSDQNKMSNSLSGKTKSSEFSVSMVTSISSTGFIYTLRKSPPLINDLIKSEYFKNLPEVEYPEVIYSDKKDIPKQAVMFADRKFKFKSNDTDSLPMFYPNLEAGPNICAFNGILNSRIKRPKHLVQKMLYTPAKFPPTSKQALKWLDDEFKCANIELESQINGPTPKNKHGFKLSATQSSTCLEDSVGLSLLSMELFAKTHDVELPDPKKHEICSIFYSLQVSCCENDGRITKGIISVNDAFGFEKSGISGLSIKIAQTELGLIQAFLELVKDCNPDILCGYEIQSSSWGYLNDRMRWAYDLDLCILASRILPEFQNANNYAEFDEYNSKKQSALSSPGRIFLNIWRLMRKQLTLTSYTIENCVYHVLHKRFVNN
jgi:hypothetical protein